MNNTWRTLLPLLNCGLSAVMTIQAFRCKSSFSRSQVTKSRTMAFTWNLCDVDTSSNQLKNSFADQVRNNAHLPSMIYSRSFWGSPIQRNTEGLVQESNICCFVNSKGKHKSFSIVEAWV